MQIIWLCYQNSLMFQNFPFVTSSAKKSTFISWLISFSVRFKNSPFQHAESRQSNSVLGDQDEMWRYGNSAILWFKKGYKWKMRAYLKCGPS